tara:strand:+ start:14027 stop:15688 length:1662 start_codon:yes stop_codon:yes gene_type:complete
MSSKNDFPEIDLVKVSLSTPFDDQKPGTSGLRKSSKVFNTQNYLESFIEAIMRTLPGVREGTLIVGGDGRYGNKRAIDIIIKIGATHGLKRIITTVNGILSTPAASHLIRSNRAIGGIILSASHNPGGIDGDFGVKVNCANGGPAPESLTDAIYYCTKSLTEFSIVKSASIPIDLKGTYKIGNMSVNVIDGVQDYIKLMESIFDFGLISEFIKKDYRIAFDAMNAVTGPYAKSIFEKILCSPKGTVRNGTPLEDFGGCHPDPNLTYANELSELLINGKDYSFGAACDGDGDRNMILGKGCFVNPSDSLAILVANSHLVPAYRGGLKGVARSMPTSSAVDVVAKDLHLKCYETPTGWKYFGNLLDASMITICGEESFGTGSDHVREKDGIWAVLFWLQILASTKCSVKEVMMQHWLTYGRNYYTRHDYEAISTDSANQLYEDVQNQLPSLVGTSFGGSLVQEADDFSYKDPVDHTETTAQGLRLLMENKSRLILRLSGTGTKGSTLRIYAEKYEASNGNLNQNPQIVLSDLINQIKVLAKIPDRTGMDKPTVIT